MNQQSGLASAEPDLADAVDEGIVTGKKTAAGKVREVRTRRAEKYQGKKDAILKQSGRLFSDLGFANASLDQVAERLGIAKPAIYYYFSSKEQILFECFIRAFDVADQIMKDVLELPLPAHRKLERYMRDYLISHLNGDAPSMPSHDLNALSLAYRTRIDRRRRVRRNRLRDLVAEAIRDQAFKPCDPTIFMSSWGGAASWVIESFDPRKGLAATDVADQVVGLFLRGVLVNPDQQDA